MSQLTPVQITQVERHLKDRLRALRAEIHEGLLRSGTERYKDMAGMVSDAGDEAVADLLADIQIAAIDRDVRELQDVESALARIGKDGFGDCVDCREAIGYARLTANPAASRCHACQERHERGYAHGGTPTL